MQVGQVCVRALDGDFPSHFPRRSINRSRATPRYGGIRIAVPSPRNWKCLNLHVLIKRVGLRGWALIS